MAETEEKPHHVFGNPNAPLWGKSTGHKKTKREWEQSVLYLLKPYREAMNLSVPQFNRAIIAAAIRIAHRYTQLQGVIDVWDGMGTREQMRVFAVDECVNRSKTDKDEFAGLMLASLKKEFHLKAEALAAINLPKLVQSSIEFSNQADVESSRERMAHLQKHRILEPPKPSQINVSAHAESKETLIPGRSFDSSMEDLDAVDAEYELLEGQKQLTE